MTGLELYQYILRKFERTDMETEVYEAITDAIGTMKLRFEFEDFKTEAYTNGITVLGEYRIALPSDFEHIIGDLMLKDDDGGSRVLVKLSKEAFDVRFPNIKETTQTRAKPTHYCIFSKTLYLGPIPDSTDYTYYMSYTTTASTPVTAATVSVPFSDKYRKTLRELALADLYFGLGDDTAGHKYKALGDEGVGLIAAVEHRNLAAPMMNEYNDC